MGAKVLSAPAGLQETSGIWPTEATEYVRLRVHCTPPNDTLTSGTGSITIAFANSADSITFRVRLPKFLESQRRDEYHLTAANRTQGFFSRSLRLNGGPTLVVGDDGVLPPLTPLAGTLPSELILEPVSLGFVVFPGAMVQACIPRLT